ncbi:MAG: hypothetical protein D6737_12715 [Chloroflexi bacterium]|nr:MAG: hypothetical protein D6737_12715 [Chloroflexota bacterium]
MAWLYLRRDGWEQGTANIRTHLKHFAAHHGHADKYHETITMFWAHLIQYAITQSPHLTEFAAFIDTYEHLLDKNLLSSHYSADALKPREARTAWIEPDLAPLPQVVKR